MTTRLKYFLLFVLVAALAYALSTRLPSGQHREPRRESDFPGQADKPLSSQDHLKPPQKMPVPPEQGKPVSKEAPEPRQKPGPGRLNLRLLGTVVNENDSPSALLRDLETNREEMLGVGSVIAGARVVSIEKDRVVLKINGKDEVLLLDGNRTRSAAAYSDKGQAESSAGTYVLSREMLRRALGDLPAALMQARAELYYKEDKPEGFLLSQIQPGSLVQSAGFRDGDVIRSVNGEEVRSMKDAIGLYQKYGGSDSFNIGILRDDKPQTLHVKIR